MNDHQKQLTVAMLGILVLTLVFSPWEESTRSGNALMTESGMWSPIWNPPDAPASYSHKIRLRTEVLHEEWLGLGIIYIGLFFCLKKEEQAVKPTQAAA